MPILNGNWILSIDCCFMLLIINRLLLEILGFFKEVCYPFIWGDDYVSIRCKLFFADFIYLLGICG